MFNVNPHSIYLLCSLVFSNVVYGTCHNIPKDEELFLHEKGISFHHINAQKYQSETVAGAFGTRKVDIDDQLYFYKPILQHLDPQNRKRFFNAIFYEELAKNLSIPYIATKFVYKCAENGYSLEGKASKGINFRPYYKQFKKDFESNNPHLPWLSDKNSHVYREWKELKRRYEFDSFGKKYKIPTGMGKLYDEFVYNDLQSRADSGELLRFIAYYHLLGIGDPNVDNIGSTDSPNGEIVLSDENKLISIDVDYFAESAKDTAFTQKDFSKPRVTTGVIAFIPNLKFNNPFENNRITYAKTASASDITQWFKDKDYIFREWSQNHKSKEEFQNLLKNIEFSNILNIDGYGEFIGTFGINMGLFPDYADLYKPLQINSAQLHDVIKEITKIDIANLFTILDSIYKKMFKLQSYKEKIGLNPNDVDQMK